MWNGQGASWNRGNADRSGVCQRRIPLSHSYSCDRQIQFRGVSLLAWSRSDRSDDQGTLPKHPTRPRAPRPAACIARELEAATRRIIYHCTASLLSARSAPSLSRTGRSRNCRDTGAVPCAGRCAGALGEARADKLRAVRRSVLRCVEEASADGRMERAWHEAGSYAGPELGPAGLELLWMQEWAWHGHGVCVRWSGSAHPQTHRHPP